MTTLIINRVVSWKTKKVTQGFISVVTSFDSGVADITHVTYLRKTRAQAKSAAIKMVRYLKAVQKQQGAN